MWHKRLFIEVIWPTILVSLIMLGLCTASAVLLYKQQAGSAQVLNEAISSRRIASELETTIKNMIDLLVKGNTRVEPLDENFHRLLGDAQQYANTETEVRLVSRLQASYEKFQNFWPAVVDSAPGGDPVQAAVAILKNDTLPLCHELRSFNLSEIEKSEAQVQRNLEWMAWGLVAIGVIGSFGGIFLGYGVARALGRSIHQLSVRIRDAADKLRQELPTVTLTSSPDMDQLHEQIQALIPQIEQVVDRLQQREHEVLRAEQLSAVGQLAAGVAHELRNPLTAIKMLVQSSKEEMERKGMAVEDLQTIELEIRRLEKCLQTFLDFARPPRMECRIIDLASVVNEVLALISGRARKQSVELRFAAPLEPVLLEADGEQLRQVLINLALNALDVMPRSGVLEVDLQVDDAGQVELKVLDTGPGIASELLPRLFQPFVSGKETGLGLGLVVSRRIVEAHGGNLSGHNRPEGGACFTLQIAGHCSTGVTPLKVSHADLVGH
jgi:two-component system, NtrC family, sensor histidine kinase HydH